MPFIFLIALLPHSRHCLRLIRAKNIRTTCTTLSLHKLSRMSYNRQSTNVSPGNAPALTPATDQPQSFTLSKNLCRINNIPENNTAERAANNSNPAVAISISNIQVI